MKMFFAVVAIIVAFVLAAVTVRLILETLGVFNTLDEMFDERATSPDKKIDNLEKRIDNPPSL